VLYNTKKDERAVLENLRRDYSKKFLDRCNPALTFDIIDRIKIAHFQRALGEKPNMSGQVIKILNDLEFDERMNTKQIISRMAEIIKVYFYYRPTYFPEKNISQESQKSENILRINSKESK
jgi:hypothetical protein